ncbi:hypothetical protein [Pseudonocardia alni]|uniref:hypothetical protein n=1 Tax=Pseudonocardia alni TaxID=33907 RepID=UPI0033C39FE6
MPLMDYAVELLRHHVGDAAPIGSVIEVRPPRKGDPGVMVEVVTDRAEWGVHLYGAVRNTTLDGTQSDMTLFFAGVELASSLAVPEDAPLPDHDVPPGPSREAPPAPPYVREYFLRIARDEPGLRDCSDQQLLDAAEAVRTTCGCMFGAPSDAVDDVARQLVEKGYLPDLSGAALVAINADALA